MKEGVFIASAGRTLIKKYVIIIRSIIVVISSEHQRGKMSLFRNKKYPSLGSLPSSGERFGLSRNVKVYRRSRISPEIRPGNKAGGFEGFRGEEYRGIVERDTVRVQPQEVLK
jgi:hypothetical protein